MHSTTLVPKGIYKVQEAEGETPREIDLAEPEEGEENVKIPTTEDMTKYSNWCHFQPNILLNCATVHGEVAENPDDPDQDLELAKKMQEAADPYELRLKPLSEDKQVRCSEMMSQDAWSIKLNGDSSNYTKANGNGTSNYGVVTVRSLLWPGAYSFFRDGQWY